MFAPSPRFFVLALVAALATGCIPKATRLAPPLALPSGQAGTTCESERWLELVPTKLRVSHTSGAGSYQVTRIGYAEGVGIFEAGQEEPTPLEDLWPRLRAPELQERHESRIRPVDDANWRSVGWLGSGLIAIAAGAGTAAAIQDDHPTGAAVAGLGGLGLGVVAGIVGWVAMPSAEESMEADARRQMLFPSEDDLGAAARSVDEWNAEQRRLCSETPRTAAGPRR